MLRWLRQLAGVDEGGSLSDAARRVATGLVGVIRVSAVPAIVLLALLSRHVDATAIAVIGVVAIVHTTTTASFLNGRHAPPWIVEAVLLGDLLLILAGVHESGGGTSLVPLLLALIPTVFAFAADPPRVLAYSLVSAAGYGVVVGAHQPLAVLVVELGWATGIALVVAAQRGALDASFARLDTMLAALSVDPAEAVLDRVGPELRMVALAPVRSVARAVKVPTRPPSAPELRALAARLGTATLRTRSIVSDLYAFSGASGGLTGALRRLGVRRAPEARVEVRVDEVLEPGLPDARLDGIILAVVRDALGVAAEGPLRTLGVRVEMRSGAIFISVDADAADEPPRENAAARRRALAGRVAAVGGELGVLDARRVEVRLPGALLGPPPEVDVVPGRALDPISSVIATVRATGPLAVLGVGAVVGGVDASFWWLAGGWSLAGIPDVLSFRRRRPSVAGVIARFVVNGAAMAVVIASAGGAQHALLPLAAFLPVAAGLILAPRSAVAVSVTVAIFVLMASGLSAAVCVAFAYATLASLALSSASVLLATGLGEVARSRTELLSRALDLEDAARRRLAGELHDDALQLMLAARQDLDEAADGDAAALAHARANLEEVLGTLERAVEELDVGEAASELPAGLPAALRTTAQFVVRTGVNGSSPPQVFVEVDSEASGRADGAIVRLVRELLTNAVRHADAQRVDVRVRRVDADILVEVFDDGVGFDHVRVAKSPSLGHIGLAAAAERVAATGGRLELHDREGGGALVLARLPAPA